VKVSWDNPVPGNNLCVYVHPELPGQQYFPQFEGTSGTAWIGPAPDGTEFEIVAISTPFGCGGTSFNIPRHKASDSVSVIRKDP
jgi:hypothetical protein